MSSRAAAMKDDWAATRTAGAASRKCSAIENTLSSMNTPGNIGSVGRIRSTMARIVTVAAAASGCMKVSYGDWISRP